MHILYLLIIKPLETLFEVLFSIGIRITNGNIPLSIIILSLTVNFLVLPLYDRADKIQKEQALKEKELEPGINHIKKTFKGDERYMMLTTFYRINNYSPFSSLNGSLSLLLEIPFFIAAYRFLSAQPILEGASFWLIKDLAKPDALINIFGITLNLLPFVMTGFNLVSSYIYSKDAPLRTKIQLVAMAIFFLFFLYTSPSGLLFYWTLNNLFSLLKNMVRSLKDPGKFMKISCALLSLGIIIFFELIHPAYSLKRHVMVIAGAVALLMPMAMRYLNRNKQNTDRIYTDDTSLHVLAVLFIFVLLGLYIPSSVISSSTLDFVDMNNPVNPATYLKENGFVTFGLVVLWVSLFYYLAIQKGKQLFNYILAIFAIVITAGFMIYGRNSGTITSVLTLDVVPTYSFKDYLINLVILAFVAALAFVIIRLRKDTFKLIITAALAALTIMSVLNFVKINNEYRSIDTDAIAPRQDNYISLSRNGKNVVVMMLDRAIGPYVPFIMEENETVRKQFEGFTYYPNAVSYGTSTNFGSPALYGGYEYTPEQINERSDTSLKDKQNEALKIMPVNFLNNGYKVTVLDPTYANYSLIPDLSIFRDYPDIKAYNIKDTFNNVSQERGALLTRNLLMYSVYKVTPLALQDLIYDGGNYNNASSANGVNQVVSDIKHSNGLSSTFMSNYNELKQLADITGINNDASGCFTLMSNDTPHEPALLQLPGYEPEMSVDNSQFSYDYSLNGLTMKMDTIQQVTHYHSNMATYMMLGNWFDYLRKIGVWDNTRIILVSDHGRGLSQFDELMGEDDYLKATCLLMVKDFNSNEFTVDETFMTNADTPYLAFRKTVNEPINPATGNKLAQADNKDDVHITFSTDYNIWENNGNVFSKGPWYSVSDNIFNKNNWKYLGEY